MVSHNKLQRLQEFPSLLIRAKNFESLKHIAWVNNIPLIRILAYNWAVSYKSPLLFSTQFGFFPCWWDSFRLRHRLHWNPGMAFPRRPTSCVSLVPAGPTPLGCSFYISGYVFWSSSSFPPLTCGFWGITELSLLDFVSFYHTTFDDLIQTQDWGSMFTAQLSPNNMSEYLTVYLASLFECLRRFPRFNTLNTEFDNCSY